MILNEVNFSSETLGLLSSMYVLLLQCKLAKMKNMVKSGEILEEVENIVRKLG